ncbi:hypothetical protein B9G55_06195 [Saccharibacillus sp. O16]|nr:hypothetical protein B9G55_06195 [Saccharibacillus sp. O16]
MVTTNAAQIRIVEYEPKYAASLAEMWNLSSDSWGGDAYIHTEESMRDKRARSSDLQTFLALDGETVVGFCSFSYYQEDEGAMYIPLLNVRPDYHSRKVGKALILNAVQRTIELGWPRLDLYTWAGNTKAVPAYKKCGFFWEKRDDTTHLMNFIPTVLRTEAVAPFFETADWYADGKRDLSLKPDGERENGFDYLTYLWEKDGRRLTMQFERTGRGLRKIETDDYSVTAEIERHRLPFGRSYPVIYRILNKSGAPLEVEIAGHDGRGVEFALSETVTLNEVGEQQIKGLFKLPESSEEPSVWRTHPGVEANLRINGLQASFKTGIAPVFPIKLTSSIPAPLSRPGHVTELQIGLESRFAEEAEIEVTLPASEAVSFQPDKLRLKLPAGGRETCSLQASVQRPGIAASQAQIEVTTGGETFTVQGEWEACFPSDSGTFWGETPNEWIAGSGPVTMRLRKSDNEFSLRTAGQKHSPFWFSLPKLGPPYSDRFIERKPVDVRLEQRGDVVALEADYDWQEPDGLTLTVVGELKPNGSLKFYHRVRRTGGQPLPEGLSLKLAVPVSLKDAVLPYNGTFLELGSGADAIHMDYWKPENLTENWLFFRWPIGAFGIVWPKSLRPTRDRWRYAFTQEIAPLQEGEVHETAPLSLSINTFQGWRTLRAHAIDCSGVDPRFPRPLSLEDRWEHGPSKITPHLVSTIHGDHPFLPETFEIRLFEHKDVNLSGTLKLTSERGSIVDTELQADPAQELREVVGEARLAARPEADLITFHLDMESYSQHRRRLVFPAPKAAEAVRMAQVEDQGHPAFELDNGIISLRVAPSFGPALYSMRYHGREWLDTSFPQAGPKSFWNPWFGGILSCPGGISLRSLQEEDIEAGFAELKDSANNIWTGIKLTVRIVKNEALKGFCYHQYFLLRPGSPVMAYTTFVEQRSGLPIADPVIQQNSYYSSSTDLRDGRFEVRDSHGEPIIYKTGRYDTDLEFEGAVRLFSAERTEKLIVVPGLEDGMQQYGVLLNELAGVHCNDRFNGDAGGQSFVRPYFHVFTDLDPQDDALVSLRGIRFERFE